MKKELKSDKEEMQMLCDFVRENVGKHDYDKCEERIIHAMCEFPHAAQPHNLMGIVLEQKGNHAVAMRHFRAAWELDPAYRPTRVNLDACGSFPRSAMFAFDESDCKESVRRGGKNHDGFDYDWNLTW